jgi:hypothetical protein
MTFNQAKEFRNLSTYYILIFLVLLNTSQSIIEFIIGFDDLNSVLISAVFSWVVTISWLLGKVAVRQYYIIKPPSEIKGFSRGPEKDNPVDGSPLD